MFSSFRNFCIAFVIAAILFSSVGYAITSFLDDTIDDILNPVEDFESKIEEHSTIPETTPITETTSPVEDPPIVEPLIGEDFTLLIAVTDYDPISYSDYVPSVYLYEDLVIKYGINNNLSFLQEYRYPEVVDFIVIHSEKDEQRFEIVPISSKLKIDCPTFTTTFGSMYQYYAKSNDAMGYQFITEKIFMLTGWMLTDIVEIHSYRLVELMQLTGSLTMTLPCNIYSDGTDYFTMIPADMEYEPGKEPYFFLTKGRVEVNSNTIIPILFLSERYETDVRNKSDILANLTEAFLNYFASKSTDDLISYFLLLTNLTRPGSETEDSSTVDQTNPEEISHQDQKSEEPTPVSPSEDTEADDPEETTESMKDQDIESDEETTEIVDQTSEIEDDTSEPEVPPEIEKHSLIQTTISFDRLLSQMDLFQKFTSFKHIILRFPYTYESNEEDGKLVYVITDLNSAHDLLFQYR